jgi:hypothetical protein
MVKAIRDTTIQIIRDFMPNLPNPDKPVAAQRPPARRSYGSESGPAPGVAAKRKSRFIGEWAFSWMWIRPTKGGYEVAVFPAIFIMPANKSGCQILFHRTGIAVIF